MSRKLVGAFALFLLFTLGGCEDSAGVGGSGSLSIFLTDNPGFLEAWVNIERIELVGGGDGEGEGGEIQVLGENLGDHDLLTLANEAVLLVDDVPVSEGTYSQLRFIIPKACIAVGEDDVVTGVYASPDYPNCDPVEPDPGIVMGTLQLPSFDQTGIKVKLPNEELVVTEDRAYLVDFDVAESFGHEAGDSKKWVMHPVIRAEDMSLTGSITVVLTKGDQQLPGVNLAASFQARLDDDQELGTFTCTDDIEGPCTTSFLYLLPGEHDVGVELQDDVELAYELGRDLPDPVTLTNDQDVTVTFVVSESSGT